MLLRQAALRRAAAAQGRLVALKQSFPEAMAAPFVSASEGEWAVRAVPLFAAPSTTSKVP